MLRSIAIKALWSKVSAWIACPGSLPSSEPLLSGIQAAQWPSSAKDLFFITNRRWQNLGNGAIYHWFDGIFVCKQGCLGNDDLKKMALTVIRRPNRWISDQNGRNVAIPKTLIDRGLLLFLRSILKRKNMCLYPESVPRNGQSFKESTRSQCL